MKKMSTTKGIVKVKIFRYNPDTDVAPTYKTYIVPWEGTGNVTQLLKQVYEEMDRTLAWRYYACGYHTSCNNCVMTINGQAAKACFTKVKPGDELTLEPMKGYPIIRDLAVDLGMTVPTGEASYEVSKGAIVKQK